MVDVTVQGEAVPALGLGTWRLTGSGCQRAVEAALEIGYRHLDTAQMYGNEAEVGAGIRRAAVPAEQLFVSTKLANDNHEPGAVRSSVEASLQGLQLDVVDLLLVHHPVATELLEDTLGAMQALVDDGLVRRLGVSNFSVELLEKARRTSDLFAVQVEYHALRTQEDQLSAAREAGLLFQAYSPLARGAVAHDEVLRAIASDVGATPAQIALRWLLDQPNVAAIPKASSRQHLQENWEALDVSLDDDARRRLAGSAERRLEAADVGV